MAELQWLKQKHSYAQNMELEGKRKKAKRGSSDISFGHVINSATNGLVFCATMMLTPLELMIFFIYQKERYINHG